MKNIEAKINIDSSQLKSAFAGINDFSKTIKDKLGNFKIGFDTSGVKSETKKVVDDVETKFGDAGKKAGDSFSSKFKSAIGDVFKAGKEAGDSFSSEFKSAIGDVFKVAGGQLLANSLSSVVTGLKNAAEAGINFEKSLADFSALTGVGGEALKGFGDSARNLSKEFGTDAISQIETFKGILSRLGPDIAKSPEALNEMAIAVNTLAMASGMDATTSMEALTTILLQFGVNLDDPIFAASEMTRAMNIMAAGAKFGAAEIPQVSEAIKVAGVEAKKANMSMEETNAAIQALGDGGKYGAEAGTALRNVLSKIAGEDIIPKAAAEKLKALGVNMNILSDTSLPLSARLKELSKAQKDATVYAQVFGVENAAAASILINSAGSIEEMTKQITGTSTGFEQAATNMDTIAFQFKKFKAQLGDMGLTLFSSIQEPLSQLMKLILNDVLPKLMPVFDAVAKGIGFIADNIDYLVPGIVTLLVPALWSVITATYAWTAALLANPITWIVLGIAALGAAIVAVIKNWDAIVAIMELAWKQFTKVVSIIWDGLVKAFNYLIKVIKEVIVFWLNWLNPIGLLYNAIEALIPGLFDLSGVFEVVKKAVLTIIQPFIDGYNAVAKFFGLVDDETEKQREIKAPKLNKDWSGAKSQLEKIPPPIVNEDWSGAEKQVNKVSTAIANNSASLTTNTKDKKDNVSATKTQVATYSDLISKLVDLEVAGKKGTGDYTENYKSAVKLKDSENERSKIQETLNKQVETEILLRDKNFKSQQQIVDLLLEQNNISISTDEIDNLRTLAAQMNIEQREANLLKEAELNLIKEKEKEILLVKEALKKEARTTKEIFKDLVENNKRDLIPPKALEQIEGYKSLLDEINEKEKRKEEKKNAKQDLIDYFATATDLSKTTSEAILESSMAFGEGLTNMVMSGTYFFKALGKAALGTIVDYVQKQVQIEGVAILSKYSSTLGPAGFVAGLAAIGIINGLLSAAMAKIQGAETGYMEGIKQVGKRGRSDTQMIWFNPKEVIIPEPMVNKNRDMLAAMFNGINPETYYKQKYEKENVNTNFVPIKTSNSINANFTHSFKDVKLKGSDIYLSIDKIKRKEMIRG